MRYRVTNTRAAWLPMMSPLTMNRPTLQFTLILSAFVPFKVYGMWARVRSAQTLHHRAAFAARNNPMAGLAY